MQRKSDKTAKLDNSQFSQPNTDNPAVVVSGATAEEIKALKTKIEELIESDEQFQKLLNLTDTGILVLDSNFYINFFTPTVREIFNLVSSDIGRPLADIENSMTNDTHLHEDLEFVLDQLEIIEREIRTRNNNWYLMRILPYRTSEDRFSGVILIFIDITKRKKDEEKLLASEISFHRLFNTIDEGFCIIEMIFDDAGNPSDYRFLEINPMFDQLTGLQNAQGKSVKELLPDIEDFWIETYGKVAVTGEPVRFENYSEKMNRWFDVYASRVGDDESRKIALVFTNITSCKQAEYALNESEERLRVAMQAAGMGTWDWDMLTGEVLWSPEHNKMYDIPVNQEIGTFEEYIARVHPEDIDAVKAELDAAIRERRTFSAEMRSIHLDGSVHWIVGDGRIFYNEKGNPERMIGVVRDITDTKRAEEALRRNEDRLRLILESITDYAIITTDISGIITGWNAGAENTFGYSTEEILGKDVAVIFTPEDRENDVHKKEMQTAIEKGRAEDKRFHLHKNGSRFFVSGVLSPLTDGNLIGFVKVARDLSKEKAAEENLRQAHDLLEERILERTAELADANEKIQRETKERLKVESERVELLKKLVQIQEEERHRIARDLHDHLGQQLTGLRLKLELLRAMCEDNKNLCEEVTETQTLAKQIDKDVGFLAWELRPTALDDLGLRRALLTYINRWSDQFGIEAQTLVGKFDEKRLAANVEINLYRILQESLNNVCKHAEAAQVNVILKRRDGNIIMIVEDDGKGFNVAKQAKPKKDGKGLGIIGMMERANLIGGTVEIESSKESGTAVFVRIPIESAWKHPRKSETDGDLK